MGKVPPSRQRYEDNHPTISIRVNRELYNQLQDLKEKGGKSFAAILREGLGIREATVGQAYQQGFADAKEKYAVSYACNVCGGLIEITSAKSKKAVAELMTEAGWGHADCHQS